MSSLRVGIVALILSVLLIAWIWAENDVAYKSLKLYLQQSPDVQSSVGPIKKFHLSILSDGTEGSIDPRAGPPHREATIGVVLVGSKGRGNVCARLRKYGQKWRVTLLYLNGAIVFDDHLDGMDSSCLTKVSQAVVGV